MEVEMDGKSEVAKLKAQIEQECQAMKAALTSYAVVSNHDTINHRYDAIGECQQQLEPLVGPKEAARIAIDIYREAMG